MRQVGIRNLKTNLSGVLRDVKAGETIEVTERGHVVARIVPGEADDEVTEVWEYIRHGGADWSGGKPLGSLRPIRVRGKPLSEIIIEDRGPR